MFEDSIFASTNSIRMRTRAGFFWAAACEAVIVTAAILIPLLYPQALPTLVYPIVMEAPAAPVREAKSQVHPGSTQVKAAILTFDPFAAPRRIPHGTYIPEKPEAPISFNPVDMIGDGRSDSGRDLFGPSAPASIVQPAAPSVVRLPSSMVEGLLLQKTVPRYPQIAVSTRTQGTVVLQATISRSGKIENLRVVSGPPMLRQAALDAVSIWVYRPYLLNGKPIAVETTVNVVFRLE